MHVLRKYTIDLYMFQDLSLFNRTIFTLEPQCHWVMNTLRCTNSITAFSINFHRSNFFPPL